MPFLDEDLISYRHIRLIIMLLVLILVLILVGTLFKKARMPNLLPIDRLMVVEDGKFEVIASRSPVLCNVLHTLTPAFRKRASGKGQQLSLLEIFKCFVLQQE